MLLFVHIVFLCLEPMRFPVPKRIPVHFIFMRMCKAYFAFSLYNFTRAIGNHICSSLSILGSISTAPVNNSQRSQTGYCLD